MGATSVSLRGRWLFPVPTEVVHVWCLLGDLRAFWGTKRWQFEVTFVHDILVEASWILLLRRVITAQLFQWPLFPGQVGVFLLM